MGLVMKHHQVAGGFCSVALLLLVCVCLSCQLTNWIISSEFKPLLPLPLQSFSLFALLFYISLSIYVSPFSRSLCSQRQDLKQHG